MGEVYTTLTKILEGITLVPESKLVLNGDESLLGKLDVKNELIFYGFKTPINENKTIDVNADSKFCKFCKTPYSYNFVTYNHLGDYYCTGCGYTHPSIKYGVDEILELTAEKFNCKVLEILRFILDNLEFIIFIMLFVLILLQRNLMLITVQ